MKRCPSVVELCCFNNTAEDSGLPKCRMIAGLNNTGGISLGLLHQEINPDRLHIFSLKMEIKLC